MKTLSSAMLLMQMGSVGAHDNTTIQPLAPSSDHIETFNEIAVTANGQLPNLFNSLTPQERVFSYYLMRASLPGHRILVDQLHRHGQTLIDLFESILHRESEVRDILDVDGNTFMNQITTYLAYLWTNHGQYFAREFSNEKRTPARLGLDLLTQDRLTTLFKNLNDKKNATLVSQLASTIFDKNYEPTNTVPSSIEQSSVNIYAPDFTSEDFASLPAATRSKINARFFIEKTKTSRMAKVETYKIDGHLDTEMRTAHYWLTKAYDHAKTNPDIFDTAIAVSLKHLLAFIETGEEEHFKKHSSAWLKSDSRIDYTFGFIETYKDPQGHRGMFEAEITIKSLDIKKLNALLPSLEERLPFPDEFQRENLHDSSALPNASINTQIFGSGEFGPMSVVAAYCLPNYNEIRSKEGSKQIIYHTQKSLGARINPDLSRKLSHLKDEAAWLVKHDPDGKLYRDLWTLHVILHETLGHGSGNLAQHTCKKTGKTFNVTSENLPTLLDGYEATLEELRAEIIALHTSIDGYETLKKSGFLYDWPEKMDKEMLINCLIKEMAQTGLRRLLMQQENATEIAGDHARANVTIMNYLIDGGGIALEEETILIEEKKHTVLGIKVIDQEQACKTIKELMIKVQTIKSTGDGDGAKALIDYYGKTVRNPEHIKIMKANHKAVVGNLKATAHLYPIMSPIHDNKGIIIDVTAQWPTGLVEQQLWWAKNALSLS